MDLFSPEDALTETGRSAANTKNIAELAKNFLIFNVTFLIKKYFKTKGEKYAKFLERVKTKKISFYELNYKQTIFEWQVGQVFGKEL